MKKNYISAIPVEFPHMSINVPESPWSIAITKKTIAIKYQALIPGAELAHYLKKNSFNVETEELVHYLVIEIGGRNVDTVVEQIESRLFNLSEAILAFSALNETP